jgi:anti-sigma regulatory factor (Ser/Thr protein kinase)
MPGSRAALISQARTAHGLELRLLAGAEGLAAAQPVLRAFLDEGGVPADLADRAELLVEEVAMNLYMHGFDSPDEAELALSATASPSGCSLVFEDAGRPFDPTAAALPDRAASLEEATPGGLGLVLLRRLASRLEYRRLPEGRNRLLVVLAPGTPAPSGG